MVLPLRLRSKFAGATTFFTCEAVLTEATSSDRSATTAANYALALDTYTTTFVSGTDKPSYLTKSGGNRIDFSWDGRGNRLSDDDNQCGPAPV